MINAIVAYIQGPQLFNQDGAGVGSNGSATGISMGCVSLRPTSTVPKMTTKKRVALRKSKKTPTKVSIKKGDQAGEK